MKLQIGWRGALFYTYPSMWSDPDWAAAWCQHVERKLLNQQGWKDAPNGSD